MISVSRIIDIDTIGIEWCHEINDHNKLEAAWPNNLLDRDYPKALF